MSVAIVARRYAQAIMQLGVESGQLDVLTGDIGRVASLFSENKELRSALENPMVSHGAKKSLMAEIGERLGVGPLAKNTLGLLVQRRRILALPYIAKALRDLSDTKKGVVRAHVTTAAPLSETYFMKLQAQLEKMTGKKVVLEKSTDPQIIAGVITRIGDRVFDGSLRTRLSQLRETMMPS